MFLAALGICDEPPTATEIVQLAVQCVLFDNGESDYAPIVGSLVQAWAALRTKELEDGGERVKIKWVKGVEAEALYQRHYRIVRETDDCWWPDSLPFDAPLPAGFIIRIAKLIARKDIAEEAAFHKYCSKDSKIFTLQTKD